MKENKPAKFGQRLIHTFVDEPAQDRKNNFGRLALYTSKFTSHEFRANGLSLLCPFDSRSNSEQCSPVDDIQFALPRVAVHIQALCEYIYIKPLSEWIICNRRDYFARSHLPP